MISWAFFSQNKGFEAKYTAYGQYSMTYGVYICISGVPLESGLLRK